MKIVFVSDVVYPYVKGGAEKRIYELSRRLVARGHNVHVFSVRWWDGPKVLVKDGITYHGVCRKQALYVNGRRSILEAVWFALCLAVPLAKEQFDVIDCNQHPYFPLFICKIISMTRRTRFFATWHEFWGDYWYEYLGKAGLLGQIIEKTAAMMPDRIVAVSERTAAALRSARLPDRKILIVSNGIPYKHIQQAPPSMEACDVFFAGRLIKDKHIDVLIQACRAATADRAVKLTIYGEGPEKERLKQLATELDMTGNVKFGGFLAEEELIARMKSARVFVLPSSREGFSITTIEALACGLPVITVDCPRNYAIDLIENGTTGLITKLDKDPISAAILTLLDDSAARQKMSEACVKAAEQYDWDLLTAEIERIYNGHNGNN
ncbi:MAG TPA: glycosyltransferase family 4 protein [Methanocella sp.]|nr:glycosyltransferase family 4 protein [Methanocella sp.]